eukprot:gene12290-12376_t
MIQIFGISSQALFGQLLIGLINGSFYALLSLGLAVIFGMLNIVNFAHGALYMMGAFCSYFLLHYAGLNYWWALILSPLIVGCIGMILQRFLLQRLAELDHIYGLLLTFGLALIIQGLFRQYYGSSGLPYPIPSQLTGARNLGFMILPNYRAWVIIASLTVCLVTWYAIERTKLGAYLRAATENPTMVRAFGVNVPRMITLTYGFGVALAAFAGVMAAPIYNVSPQMGAELIIVVFAVVVIGGMGSILGSIMTGFALGIVEGLTKVFYPEASNTIVFVVMAIPHTPAKNPNDGNRRAARQEFIAFFIMAGLLCAAPLVAYPVFLMKALCMALFACAFNLLVGYVGLLSFGHAMFLGSAGYVTAHAAKVWGLPPELAILAGTAAATVLGLGVGLLAIRRQGIYFSMTTLAFAQMVYFLALELPFTHGEDGIQAVPRGKFLGFFDLSKEINLYFFVLVIFLGAFLLIRRIINSPFGEVLKAIRENERRAISLGYKVDQYKIMAFVLSAALAGLAGATKDIVFQLASLTDVHFAASGEVVLMTLLGGMGTLFGPVVGAFIIISTENYLAAVGDWVSIIQGVIFVVCVMAFRKGIVGVIAQKFKLSL